MQPNYPRVIDFNNENNKVKEWEKSGEWKSKSERHKDRVKYNDEFEMLGSVKLTAIPINIK